MMADNNRIHQLDYLRGLGAFVVMIYHYLFWNFETIIGGQHLSRVAIYGVSSFYILSGLTLYHIYFEKLEINLADLTLFFKKRVLRIFPLLWVATLLTIVLFHQNPSWDILVLNLTGLYGLFNWNNYIATGAWSIGNELVFYLFFPLFVVCTKKSSSLWLLMGAGTFLIFLYYTFILLDPAIKLSNQWKTYVNPLNQLFYFFGGFSIAHLLKLRSFSKNLTLPLMVVSALIFVLLPAPIDEIKQVSGTTRIILTMCCFAICFSLYNTNWKLPNIIHRPLCAMGETSFSIYLLHPIVLFLVGRFSNHVFELSMYWNIIISILATLLTSHFVFKYFESYFIGLGRNKRKSPQL